jgi:hypothetical protein
LAEIAKESGIGVGDSGRSDEILYQTTAHPALACWSNLFWQGEGSTHSGGFLGGKLGIWRRVFLFRQRPVGIAEDIQSKRAFL